MRYRFAASFALAASIFTPSCTVDMGVDADGQITCARDAQCPDGFVCKATIARCVPSAAEEATPTVVGAVTIDPSPANAAATITVSFTVNTPLAEAPLVVLGDSTRAPFDLVREEALEYTLSIPANRGSEGTWPILASLTGAQGTVNPDLQLGSILLDFTGPQLASPLSPTPAVAGRAGTEVLVTARESLREPPELSIACDDGQTFSATLVETLDDRTYRFAYEPTGDESDAVTLQVELTDLAGNVATIEDANALRFDFVGPQLLPNTTSLRLTPPPESPLFRVEALGLGGLATLIVVFDELCAPEAESGYPRVRVTPDGPGFTCTSMGTAFECQLTLLAGESYPQGAQTIEVAATDLLGNVATTLLDDPGLRLVIDTQAPEEPGVDDPGVLVFSRHPWGDPWGEPSYTLTGADHAVEESSLVRILTPTGSEILRLSADPDGGFGPVPLLVSDLETVALQVVDAAGNASDADPDTAGAQPTLVREVSWSASFIGKLAGSSLVNPHRFVSRPYLGTRLVMDEDTEYSGATGIDVPDGTSVATDGASFCSLLHTGALPEYRGYAGAVFNSARQVLELHGGITWDWAPAGIPAPRAYPLTSSTARLGTRWATLSATDPEGDTGPATIHNLMAYDRWRNVSVLAPLGNEQTWLWTGVSWRRVDGPATVPAEPGHRAVAHDPIGQRIVLAAALSGTFALYAWDGASWQPACDAACQAGPKPAPAGSFAMAYDEVREEMLLVDAGSLWAWPHGGAWEQRCVEPACSAAPSARYGFALAYDPLREQVVLYGGCAIDDVLCSASYFDLWTWNGTDWNCPVEQALCPGCTPPPGGGPASTPLCNTSYETGFNDFLDPAPSGTDVPLNGSGAALVFDESRGRLVLAGGQGGLVRSWLPEPYDAWEWDGAAWQRYGNSGPGSLARLATYESEAGNLVVAFVGGQTWVFEDGHWTESCLSDCTPPPVTSGGAMAFDPGLGKILLFGGSFGGASQCALWAWDPVNQWQKLWPSGACGGSGPEAMNDPRMAYHQGLAGMLVQTDNPWLWKDGNWMLLCGTECSPIGPPFIPELGAVGWDPASGAMLMHGGYRGYGALGASDDAYRLENGSWQTMSQQLARFGHTITAVPERGLAVLFGGSMWQDISGGLQRCTATSGSERCDSIFVRAEDTWQEPPVFIERTVGRPPPRVHHGATVDPTGAGVVIHGGDGLADTWRWDSGAFERPAHIATIEFGAARASNAEVTGLTIRWHGGGVGYPGGTATSGLAFLLWDGHRWRATTSDNTAEVGAPADVLWESDKDPEWSSMTPADWGHLLGPERVLHLAVTPAAPNGKHSHYGAVLTDAAEVTVQYRRP